MKYATSAPAKAAASLILGLQNRLVSALERIENAPEFEKMEWLRAGGEFGGGHRYVSGDNAIFNRAAVNYSQVQYENDFDKPLNSATAISTIIHPENPHAPSAHMHYSFTEMKDGTGYWRVMADLNPSVLHEEDKMMFLDAMSKVGGKLLADGMAQGDKYFNIPVLGRTRGVAHFYLEGYHSDDAQADIAYVQQFAETMIDTYAAILTKAVTRAPVSDKDKQIQLDYHTSYLFQVLTLDRGTTSGLLVHNENDVGILGSIPKQINRKLLASWKDKMPAPQGELIQNIVDVLPDMDVVTVADAEKQSLAAVVRAHFTEYPESLNLQAKGDVIPPTVANHS